MLCICRQIPSFWLQTESNSYSLTPITSLGPSNVTKSILLGWKPALVTTSYSQSIKSDCPKDSSICVGLCFIQTWKKCTAARVWRCSFAFHLPKAPPILPPSKAIFANLLISFISIETGQNHSKESYCMSETNTVSLSYMSEYFIIHIWIFRTAVTHYSSVSILSYPRQMWCLYMSQILHKGKMFKYKNPLVSFQNNLQERELYWSRDQHCLVQHHMAGPSSPGFVLQQWATLLSKLIHLFVVPILSLQRKWATASLQKEVTAPLITH